MSKGGSSRSSRKMNLTSTKHLLSGFLLQLFCAARADTWQVQ